MASSPHSKQRGLVVPGGGRTGEDIRREQPRAHAHAHENRAPVVTAAATRSGPTGHGAAATTSPDKTTAHTVGPLPSRVDWATLLHRVYDVDALACPCGGRLGLLELVTDPAEVRGALDRLGLDDERPGDTDEPRIRGP